MRVSTALLFELGQIAIARAQGAVLHLQQQVASGRRVLAPSDDPLAAAAALETGAAQAANARFAANRVAARNRLERLETALASAAGLIAEAREKALAASNPVLSAADRASLAAAVEQNYQALLALANSQDAAGRYLFSGYRHAVQPFAPAPSGADYAGDEGRLCLAIGAAREIETSFSGAQVFQRARSGNGVFLVRAHHSNTGTGVVGASTVADAAAVTGHTYRIEFSGSGSAPRYDVVDETLGTTLVTAVPYVPGAPIAFDGLKVELSGLPAAGDRFVVQPAPAQDLFRTLSELAALLRRAPADAAQAARNASELGLALADLDQGLDHLTGLRAEVGARLAELDAFDEEGAALEVLYAARRSRLEDLDYAAALSELERTLAVLEAAQKSFLRLSSLGLFSRL
jgi:flagellar hook-associated protein 3 FlgL